MGRNVGPDMEMAEPLGGVAAVVEPNDGDDDDLKATEVKVPFEVIDLCRSSSDEGHPTTSSISAIENPTAVAKPLDFLVINRRKKKKRKKKKRRKWHECFVPQEPARDGDVKKQPQTKGAERGEARPDALVADVVDIPQVAVVSCTRSLQADSKVVEDCAYNSKSVKAASTCQGADGVGSAASSASGKDGGIGDLSNSECVGQVVPLVATTSVKSKEYGPNALKETAKVDVAVNQDDGRKDAETVTPLETTSVETGNNLASQKLLRGPRYFDFATCSKDACFNCVGDGHGAVDCIVKWHKKPCFICGGFGHEGKHRIQGLSCFFCQKRGHIFKDSPEKNKGSHPHKTCLRCGNSGHGMESCTESYSLDDLRKIRCYVCNDLGHLCCVDFPDMGPGLVSCYNCGRSGHAGLVCKKPRGIFRCFVCGKEGHFAAGCMNADKVKRERRSNVWILPAAASAKEN